MLRLACINSEIAGQTLVALCVVGETYGEVIEVAKMALHYYESRGPKPGIEVSLKKIEKLFEFNLIFGGPSEAVTIQNIEESSVVEFLKNISKSPGYGICLASGMKRLDIVPFETFFMVKSDIEINGKLVMLKADSGLWREFQNLTLIG